MNSVEKGKYLILDVESTGTSSNDEVIQFSGFLLDEDLMIESLVNFYAFTVKPISPEAYRVHGISTEQLYKLSTYDPGDGSPVQRGCTFEQQLLLHTSELLTIENLTYVCYSNSYFDFKMINQTLRLQGLPEINFGNKCTSIHELKEPGTHHFDVMSALRQIGFFPGRQCNLTLATSLMEEEFGIKVASLFRTLCQARNLSGNAKSHDALYDAFELTYLFVKYFNRFR